MHKTYISLLGAALIMVFTGCSNPNVGMVEGDSGTLRATADILDTKTEWTEELEKARLTKTNTSVDGIDQSVDSSPMNIFASGNEGSYAPIYPSIPDFSVLNYSSLDPNALSVIDGFCTAITKNVDADSYMQDGHLYSLVLFLYDLDMRGEPLFKSYILGEPFISDDGIECPVRFYYENKKIPADYIRAPEKVGSAYDPSLDINLYLVKQDSVWKIDQIAYDLQ
jgi:hypothetical protein